MDEERFGQEPDDREKFVANDELIDLERIIPMQTALVAVLCHFEGGSRNGDVVDSAFALLNRITAGKVSAEILSYVATLRHDIYLLYCPPEDRVDCPYSTNELWQTCYRKALNIRASAESYNNLRRGR